MTTASMVTRVIRMHLWGLVEEETILRMCREVEKVIVSGGRKGGNKEVAGRTRTAWLADTPDEEESPVVAGAVRNVAHVPVDARQPGSPRRLLALPHPKDPGRRLVRGSVRDTAHIVSVDPGEIGYLTVQGRSLCGWEQWWSRAETGGMRLCSRCGERYDDLCAAD